MSNDGRVLIKQLSRSCCASTNKGFSRSLSMSRQQSVSDDLDHEAITNHIMNHPRFKEMVSGFSRSAAESSDETQRRENLTSVEAELASVLRGKSSLRDRKGKRKRDSRRDIKKPGRPSVYAFTRDVVLLPSQDCENVPTHARRKLLAGGFVLNLFSIDFGWDEGTLREEIQKGFHAKLRPLFKDVEFVNINAFTLQFIYV